MRIIYTVVADCDPPPDDDYMQAHGDGLDKAREAAVASFLLSAGASVSVSASAKVDV